MYIYAHISPLWELKLSSLTATQKRLGCPPGHGVASAGAAAASSACRALAAWRSEDRASQVAARAAKMAAKAQDFIVSSEADQAAALICPKRVEQQRTRNHADGSAGHLMAHDAVVTYGPLAPMSWRGSSVIASPFCGWGAQGSQIGSYSGLAEPSCQAHGLLSIPDGSLQKCLMTEASFRKVQVAYLDLQSTRDEGPYPNIRGLRTIVVGTLEVHARLSHVPADERSELQALNVWKPTKSLNQTETLQFIH